LKDEPFTLLWFLHAKDYYLAGLYGPAFALGAIVAERFVRAPWMRSAYAAVGFVVAVSAWPGRIALLDPPVLATYLGTPIGDAQSRKAASGKELIPQNLGDQLGWRELASDVSSVYHSLSPEERTRTAIIATNWGEASALDFFGADYALPPALSGQNQYYLWGVHGFEGNIIIYVNSSDPSWWAKRCRQSRVAAWFGRNEFADPSERHRPIVLCRGFYRTLANDWPEFRSFD
jgi:hypothetical protein